MALVRMTCESCGAPLTQKEGMFRCEHCGASYIRVADPTFGADAENISLGEFEKMLEENSVVFAVDRGGSKELFDVDSEIVKGKLAFARARLRDGAWADAVAALDGVGQDVFAAERIRLLASVGAADETQLAAYSGDLSALPEFENVKRLADERTRNAYERLADICRANAVAEEKIAKGMELVDAQAAESALVYAKEMLRSYPAHAKAWGLYIAAKCLADRSYDPTRDIGFMCKCPDYKRVYLEDGFSPRVLAPVAAERYAATEGKRNARSAALKKYVIGPVFAAAAVAMGIAVWKILEALGG